MIIAYIDPTTTSTLLYVVIGVAASVGYAFRGLFYKIRDVALLSNTGGTCAEDGLVVYSEGRQCWPVFEPVLTALDGMGVGYLYVFSGADDPGLKHTGENVHTRYVSPNLTPSYLNHLRARPELLKDLRARSARDLMGGGDVKGDVAMFEISMKDSESFIWTDGSCYVGVSLPKSALKPGDTVELLVFKFEFVK